MSTPTLSIIIPTYNSAHFIEACLQSVKNQTSSDYELIVVDNHSTDQTAVIARTYTDKVFTRGPERSAQRNYGAKQAKGDYLLFIDSDMELAPNLVKDCLAVIEKQPELVALVVPEQSFGVGFWAECKRLEKEFYLGQASIEAARCYRKTAFVAVGGYDEGLISGEDWDLSERISGQGLMGRIHQFVHHNEGHLTLWRNVKKKFYYAQHFARYMAKQQARPNRHSLNPLAQFGLFFSRPDKIVRQPLVWLGLIVMKFCEFGFGGLGLLVAKTSPQV